ncbi:tetratricopeptide repeat protein [Haliangium sp.]|uniref:tetratricopeptide repeat protein n=1 Tax=Haliangium sp. TaxID=2663208 RepID=UPI003D12BEDA
MSRKRGPGGSSDTSSTPAERVLAMVARAPGGLHWLGEPARLLDAAWPDSLVEVYRAFDGASLFHEAVVLVPATQVRRRADAGVSGYAVGSLDGDDLVVDDRARVWRHEQDSGEWLPEGERFDRWLLGVIEAQEVLYERDGEFADEVFDDSGEPVPEVSERMQRRILKRDRDAPGPRWRLARALVQQGKVEAGRDQLETLVAARPEFAWAWYDLARISESLGALEQALDEMEAAATAQPGYEHAGFFWAQAARLARALGDEARRQACADRARADAPDLAAGQREGAQASLDEGDLDAALELVETALALSPRDLVAVDLRARIQARREAGDD